MRYLVTIVLAVFAVACGGSRDNPVSTAPKLASSASARGSEIVAEYLRRDSARFKKNRIRFTVTEEGEADKVVEIETYRKQSPDETITFTKIVSPPEDSGLGSLTTEVKGKRSVVVTYSVFRGEFRETGTEKIFIGGLTAGELLGEWDKFDYKLLGEKDVDGVKAFEVEAMLKPTASSIASSMIVLFRSDNYLPVELHTFGADGKEIRTFKTTQIKGGPDRPYSARIEADNFVYKTHITIERLTNEFPEKIDDAVFDRENLKKAVKK